VSAIHQSLTQPILLAGAERPLAIANWIAAAALILGGGLHWYTIATGAFLLTVGHWALVQAANFDPQLSRVYVRHINYQDYPARASVTAPLPRIRPSVPTPKETRALWWRGGKMFLKEFKDLRRKRDKLLGLPDQLNYAIPIDDYTIALKDGAFLSAFDCFGLDLNLASVEELDAHRAQGNRALARLDDGFMYNVDLIHHPSVEYSSRAFPDPVSAALDREREIQYSAEGQHFETRCVLTITYRPPADAQTRIAGVFLSGAPNDTHWRRQHNRFKQKLREFEDAISPVRKLTALSKNTRKFLVGT
jgi:type IV secretory pathway TrbD component